MVSLVIYVTSFVIVIAIVATITTFFNNNIRNLQSSESTSSEYNKFNLYMLEYTKNGYEIQKCDKTEKGDQYIIFSKNGKSDTFVKLGNILYFNQVKLCENVEEFQLDDTQIAENGKSLLKTYIQINGTAYTTDYVLE